MVRAVLAASTQIGELIREVISKGGYMMRPRFSVLSLALCIASVGLPVNLFCRVQDRSSELPALPSQAEVRSEEWTVRRAAFARLIGLEPETYVRVGLPSTAPVMRNILEKAPSTRDVRTLGLTQLLLTENAVVEGKSRKRIAEGLTELDEKDRLSEAYLNYHGDLIAAVVILQDLRSLDALVGAIATGNMVTGTLVAFGKQAVAPVARQLQHPDPHVRYAAARTLSQIVTAGTAKDAISQSRLKVALLGAAGDNDAFVRREAVDGLVQLDSECIAIVERLARTDPYRAEFLDGRYLVREAALRALQSRSK